MSFIDEDFNCLKQDSSEYNDNYESDFNVISRRLALTHALHYILFLKNKLKHNEEVDQQEIQD